MDNTNEKLSTIIAKMRGENFKPPVYQRVNDYADQIKTAAKRERESAEADALYAGVYIEATRHGSAAAMRKALNSIVGTAEDAFNCPERDREASQGRALSLISDAARAALSMPPRNCDVGTVEEQLKRWESFCSSNWNSGYAGRGFDPCDDCKLVEYGNCRCQLAWAQMPYEEKEKPSEQHQ